MFINLFVVVVFVGSLRSPWPKFNARWNDCLINLKKEVQMRKELKISRIIFFLASFAFFELTLWENTSDFIHFDDQKLFSFVWLLARTNCWISHLFTNKKKNHKIAHKTCHRFIRVESVFVFICNFSSHLKWICYLFELW